MNNQEKGDYLLDAISNLESAMSQGRFTEYPYRKSLRERIKRVLTGTRAERLIEAIQNKYVPESGDFSPIPAMVMAGTIKASNDESLLDAFECEILELELGL